MGNSFTITWKRIKKYNHGKFYLHLNIIFILRSFNSFWYSMTFIFVHLSLLWMGWFFTWLFYGIGLFFFFFFGGGWVREDNLLFLKSFYAGKIFKYHVVFCFCARCLGFIQQWCFIRNVLSQIISRRAFDMDYYMEKKFSDTHFCT